VISDKYYSVSQAAAKIGCDNSRVRQLCIDGTFTAEKVANSPNAPWFIDRKQVDRYAENPQHTGRPRSRAS
jgi:hypothetical protein